jgi:restriction system protein
MMAKQRSYHSIMTAIAREEARRTREYEKAVARAERESIRLVKQREKALILQQKEQKQRYIEERLQEVEELNNELERTCNELTNILNHTLEVNDTIEFDSLKVHEPFVPPSIPDMLTRPTPPPNKEVYLRKVKPPTLLEKALGMKGRYQKELAAAEGYYRAALHAHEVAETERIAKLLERQAANTLMRQAYEAKVMQREAEVAELEKGYKQGDIDAVITYNSMVLERSVYPDGFPQNFRIAYQPEAKELVIDYQLPDGDIVPQEAEFRYVKTKDAIESKARKVSERKALYQDVIASVTLRTIHEVFEADQGDQVQVVTFSGYVDTIDPATGLDVQKYVVSTRATKAEFSQLNLKRIDKLVCLRNMGARVSPQPLEQQAVKPVIEFDMVDKRFIEQRDILTELESRPNLMELLPSEFETLTSNLFNKMGLETKLTRTSKDGGVDVVAYDLRPVLGGKVVIQAKRYRHPVGVSAVRDLYGTMQHEGANKGILVTTSSYGPDAYAFVKDKPIELIDGGGLLYLLNEVGIHARIVMPQGE